MYYEKSSHHLFHREAIPETIVYTLFAAFLIGVVFYLFYYDPVNYTRLIAEDHFAEYATSVSFALAGVVLLSMSTKPGPGVRRIIWGGIGVIALVLAAEEISWGQRIIGVETPYVISKQNLQGELTLHNLAGLDSINRKLHSIAAYLILGYVFISIVVSTCMSRFEARLANIGLPSIRFRLIPVFLLPPFFFLFYPVVKEDEIGECLLGVAVLMWAVDLFLRYRSEKPARGYVSLWIMAGFLFVVSLMSATLTYYFPGNLSMYFNNLASRDYPRFEMYDQALEIYDFMYKHPKYINDQTRINHSAMLQQIGRKEEADQLLLTHISDIREKLDPSTGTVRSRLLRKLGTVYLLLSERKQANELFDESLEIDRGLLTEATSGNKKVVLMWSISKTLTEQGNIEDALTLLRQAIDFSEANSLSPAYRYWMEKDLTNLQTK